MQEAQQANRFIPESDVLNGPTSYATRFPTFTARSHPFFIGTSNPAT
jgi:hypothetical protein